MPTEPADVVRALWQRIWIEGALDELGDLVADPYVRHTREGTTAQSPAEYGRSVGAATDALPASHWSIASRGNSSLPVMRRCGISAAAAKS